MDVEFAFNLNGMFTQQSVMFMAPVYSYGVSLS